MQSANGIRAQRDVLTTRSQISRGEAIQQQSLNVGQTHAIESRPGLEIFLQSGVLWLTLEGEPGDVLLRAGQKWTAAKAGRLVLQAIVADARWTVRAPEVVGRAAKWLRYLAASF